MACISSSGLFYEYAEVNSRILICNIEPSDYHSAIVNLALKLVNGYHGHDQMFQRVAYPDTRYAFAQSLLSGVCEGTITNTGNYFDVSQDTEMVLDMNETASSNPDTGRNLRGSQSVTTVLG